jgi:hypothetical protein
MTTTINKQKLSYICHKTYDEKNEIYCMSASDDSTIVKIGVANDTIKRHRDLQKEQKVKNILHIEQTVNAAKMERLIHLFLSNIRNNRFITKNHKEWFRITPKKAIACVKLFAKITATYDGQQLYDFLISFCEIFALCITSVKISQLSPNFFLFKREILEFYKDEIPEGIKKLNDVAKKEDIYSTGVKEKKAEPIFDFISRNRNFVSIEDFISRALEDRKINPTLWCGCGEISIERVAKKFSE